MKIMLDTGIISHSEFSQMAVEERSGQWGGLEITERITGLIRKEADKNEGRQREIDALFTVGRMIREKRVGAFSYPELNFERIRGRGRELGFNALNGCEVKACLPAIERSIFRHGLNFLEYASKGGRKDHRTGNPTGGLSQIAFFEWLCELSMQHVAGIVQCRTSLKLSQFDVDSLLDLQRFQLLCQASGSRENYPDMFHVWTAEHNRLDCFLSLDYRLANIVSAVGRQKKNYVDIQARVLSPLGLLAELQIKTPDRVPMEFDRFYRLI